MIDTARLLDQTLVLVAPGAAHSLIVGEALRNAGEIEVPQDLGAFRKFAEGPLRHAATDILGEEQARSLVSKLLTLAAASSGSGTLPMTFRAQATQGAPTQGTGPDKPGPTLPYPRKK